MVDRDRRTTEPAVVSICGGMPFVGESATPVASGRRRLNFLQAPPLRRWRLPSPACHHKDITVNRRDFSTALILTGIGSGAVTLAGPALAQAPAPAEGAQYTRIDPPVPPSAPLPAGKVEVLEFFSYACPHCNVFEPTVEAWESKPPANVVFRRVPVAFLYNYENFMRTYYALETMNQVAAMQRKVFAALHVEKQQLAKPEDIAALMAKNGIDATKFLATFKSFSVATSVARAKKLMAAYKIDGVPTLAVGGRYTTSPGLAGGSDQAMAVVDFLAARPKT
jgi:thiol:disulfide interchange protein DsbA